MATKIIFKDNIVQYANRYSLTDLGGGLYEITASPGTVTQAGTGLSAANLNAIADEVIFKLKDTSASTTTYTANLNGIASYYEGLTILFKPANTNTATATININNVGAINIKKVNNNGNKVDLVANDMVKNKYFTMVFDGADFILNNPSADVAQVITDIQNIEDRLDTDETSINTLKTQAARFGVATGNSNAYGVSLNDVTTYYTNLIINLVPNFDNTGACTLQVNSLDAKPIKFNGAELVAGDLKTNKLYTLIYNGVDFELQVSSDKVASHWAETATGAHKAKNILVEDTAGHFTSNPKNIENVLTEVFTNVDNGKNTVYSAIVGKGITPVSKDFADLVAGVNSISAALFIPSSIYRRFISFDGQYQYFCSRNSGYYDSGIWKYSSSGIILKELASSVYCGICKHGYVKYASPLEFYDLNGTLLFTLSTVYLPSTDGVVLFNDSIVAICNHGYGAGTVYMNRSGTVLKDDSGTANIIFLAMSDTLISRYNTGNIYKFNVSTNALNVISDASRNFLVPFM